MSTDYARHRPRSHPVVQARLRGMAGGVTICEPDTDDYYGRAVPPIDVPADGVLPPMSAAAISRMSDRLDQLAKQVLELPDQPLTVGQRRAVKCIAAELMRRGTDGELGL